MTNYFRKAKEHGTQWQKLQSHLFFRYGRVAAQLNRHGNCATATVNTVASTS